MMRSNLSSPVYGGGALRSSVEGAVIRRRHSTSMCAFPLRLASLASSPVNGGGKLPALG
jgi:hypothetical protein